MQKNQVKKVAQIAAEAASTYFIGEEPDVINYDGQWVLYAEGGELDWAVHYCSAIQDALDRASSSLRVEPINGCILGVYAR